METLPKHPGSWQLMVFIISMYLYLSYPYKTTPTIWVYVA